MNSRENGRGEKMIANIDKFYFGVLCKGDQRDGGRWRGSGDTGDFFL